MPVLFGGRSQRAAVTGRGGKRSAALLPRVGMALVGLAALALAACVPGGGNQVSLAKDQIFTWPYLPLYSADNSIMHDAVLDPAALTAAADSGTIGMLYAGLVTYDSNLRVVPDAATWDMSNNGTAYTFHLRHNMHFSDGTPLTAEDYAYSLDRALDPNLCTYDAKTYGPQTANNSCYTIADGYLGFIIGAQARINGKGGADHSLIAHGDDPQHGVNVIDQYTLKIWLTAPYGFFLEALTYPTSYPVEKALVDKYPGGTWVDHLDQGGCSGPFKVMAYDGGKQLRLVPNTYWEQAWGKQLTLTEVDRPYDNTTDAEYQAYRAGKYDFTRVPGSQYIFARGQDDFYEVPTLVTQYFGLNQGLPPFDSLLVRRAFDLALNKQLLVDGPPLNGAALPTNHIVPHGMPGFDDALVNPPPDGTQAITGNQSAARSLLQQAIDSCKTQPEDFCPYLTNGGQSQQILVWVSPANPTRVGVVQAAVKQWNDVLGLNVLAKVDATTNGNIRQGGPLQAWAIGWLADYPDPQDWLTLQFHSGAQYAANNATGVHDAGLDTLLDKADQEQNVTTRMQEYNKAEQQVVNLVAWIPYAQDKLYWRQRSWVHGFGLNALQLIVDTSWADIYITEH